MRLKIFSFSLSFLLLFGFISCKDFTNTVSSIVSNDTTFVVFPAPLGSVSDYEDILTDEQIRSLDSIIMQHENRSKNEISIISVKSTAPYHSLNEYSNGLFESWGKNVDKGNSLLISISENSKEVVIIVGHGLQRKLTEKERKRIIEKTIQTEFEKGDYYLGLKNGLKKIITEIR